MRAKPTEATKKLVKHDEFKEVDFRRIPSGHQFELPGGQSGRGEAVFETVSIPIETFSSRTRV